MTEWRMKRCGFPRSRVGGRSTAHPCTTHPTRVVVAVAAPCLLGTLGPHALTTTATYRRRREGATRPTVASASKVSRSAWLGRLAEVAVVAGVDFPGVAAGVAVVVGGSPPS